MIRFFIISIIATSCSTAITPEFPASGAGGMQPERAFRLLGGHPRRTVRPSEVSIQFKLRCAAEGQNWISVIKRIQTDRP